VKEISDFIEKAEKFLITAEHALNIGDYDSCVSRCYYAMFFMAEAILLTKNLSASSQKGVISLFGEHFTKTGTFDREMGKALTDAYDKRLVGDYGIRLYRNREGSKGFVRNNSQFCSKIEKLS